MTTAPPSISSSSSALEVFLNDMRYINPRFTYFTYFFPHRRCRCYDCEVRSLFCVYVTLRGDTTTVAVCSSINQSINHAFLEWSR